MTVSPTLFTGSMVRAILRDVDPKWQTRRLITRANSYRDGVASSAERWAELDWSSPKIFVDRGPSPAGNPGPYLHVPDLDGDASHRIYPRRQPGDRLWVRETGWERPERTNKMMHDGADTWVAYYYDADQLSEQDHGDFKAWGFKRRPSIFMPRWASRVTLEITGMRVERLQDISEEDSIAEGIEKHPTNGYWIGGPHSEDGGRKFYADARLAYRDLWNLINGTGAWDTNPWVWVVEFKRV
jgi:hypothetical protein